MAKKLSTLPTVDYAHVISMKSCVQVPMVENRMSTGKMLIKAESIDDIPVIGNIYLLL